jgi:hypothetical protein
MWVCAIIVANHHRHNCPIRIHKLQKQTLYSFSWISI